MDERGLTADRTVDDVRVGERAVTLGLLGVIVALNVANLVAVGLGADDGGSRYFLLALERNPSTWFSAAQLALAGTLAFAVGHGRRDVVNWRLVGAVLWFLSLDEVATLHERLGGLPVLPGIGTRAWAGAGLLLAALLGLRLAPWVLRLEAPLRFALLAGSGLFVAGAVGFEVLAGDRFVAHGEDLAYWVLSSVEEDLELLGVFVVARLLLAQLAASGTRVTLAFR